MNEIIFSLTPEHLEKGSIIFSVDDEADKMYIIQNGMVEIYTAMENSVDFIIERLYRGSVINNRSFLLRDKIDIFARCSTPVTIYCLTFDRIMGKLISTNLVYRNKTKKLYIGQ